MKRLHYWAEGPDVICYQCTPTTFVVVVIAIKLSDHVLRNIHHCTFLSKISYWLFYLYPWKTFPITVFSLRPQIMLFMPKKIYKWLFRRFTRTCNYPISFYPFYPILRFYTWLSTLTQFITAKTAFHHCTFSFITAHFVHHCTLKQAMQVMVGLIIIRL